MKNISLSLVLLLLVFTAEVKAIDAYFDFKLFHIPGEGPMVETYLNFFGETLQYDSVERGQQSTVEITMMFLQGEEIVSYSKKNLSTKTIVDSLYDDLIDQQRFLLDYGEYVLEINLRHPGAPDSESETLTEAILIDRPESEVFFSDIQFIAAFKKASEPTELTKSGYDILPFISNYVPRQMNDLMFYAELYGTDLKFEPEEPFIVRLFIENSDRNRIIESLHIQTRHTPALVIPVMKQFDISGLPTGNYRLSLEVRDQHNELVTSKKRFFQRVGDAVDEDDYLAELDHNVFSTRINNIDTLYEYIQSLRPIAGDGEKSLIDRFGANKDIKLMQRFFYNFWKERDNANPAFAWENYLENVNYVNDKYGVPSKKGYETDMGRFYLAYGPPDVVTDRPSEPTSYPYQIWQYFRAERWTNVRAVFYDRTLLQHDYELLHCDKIPGEIKNPRWDMLIHQRDTPLNNVDRTRSRDHYGGRTQDFWQTPR